MTIIDDAVRRFPDMKTFLQFGACLSLLVATTAPTLAQSNDDAKTYEVSELRLQHIPIPTARPDRSDGQEKIARSEIRRTAEGIRIVGPAFFPEDR
ncbi:hypothetical protein [Jiella marina]|uniref:hypothetical protein n=1 Tax=Jiella sp. LLJ827 TaxID=2917712 RepID=UPI0021015E2D|nr:hypothetical protein [Jiella sp. LLJ827]MCQ0989368.1 hypothetical protein [Jiella sp. LLJ827]